MPAGHSIVSADPAGLTGMTTREPSSCVVSRLIAPPPGAL